MVQQQRRQTKLFRTCVGNKRYICSGLNKKTMLTENKLKIIQQVLASSSKEEIIWLNGYIAGLIANSNEEDENVAPAKSQVGKITIAYGTESGNSKKLATAFATQATQNV